MNKRRRYAAKRRRYIAKLKHLYVTGGLTPRELFRRLGIPHPVWRQFPK